jgi:hypothetical protein
MLTSRATVTLARPSPKFQSIRPVGYQEPWAGSASSIKRAQLPSTVRATVAGPGSGLHLRAQTVPRRTLRVPYYQRNVDNDKVIFYHSCEFMSRRGVGAGSITQHP